MNILMKATSPQFPQISSFHVFPFSTNKVFLRVLQQSKDPATTLKDYEDDFTVEEGVLNKDSLLKYCSFRYNYVVLRDQGYSISFVEGE